MKRIIITSIISVAVTALVAQSSDRNYVKTVTYLDKNGSGSITNVQYYDGLGCPDVSVTGGANTSGKYLYSFQSYDGCGRAETVSSPVAGGTTPIYKTLSDIQSLSQNLYGDNYGYSTTTYDALDRPTFVSTPGAAWVGKGKSSTYGTNAANEVKKYNAGSMPNFTYYPKNTLQCTQTMDEDGHIAKAYKDLFGNVVLERRIDGNTNFDTYYVYNSLNQLSYVLQPMFQDEDDLGKFSFQYTYDEYGRMKTKTIPGCEPVEYWYDNADRVVKMEDGEMKHYELYRTYEYDALGRLSAQRIIDGEDDDYSVYRTEILNFYDTYTYLATYKSLIPFDKSNSQSYMDPIDKTKGYGKITGTIQEASNGRKIFTSFSYDEYGRVVRQTEIDINKNAIIKKFSYTFTGEVKQEETEIYKYDSSTKMLAVTPYSVKIEHLFGSTNNNLLQKSVICISDGTNQMKDTIQNLKYDDFGRALKNDRSGTAGDMSYTYDNLHGWLKQIKSAGGFEQNMYRETEGATTRWNGTISAMTWSTNEGTLHRYDYTYDGLNRLTDADYKSKLLPILSNQAKNSSNDLTLDGTLSLTLDNSLSLTIDETSLSGIKLKDSSTSTLSKVKDSSSSTILEYIPISEEDVLSDESDLTVQEIENSTSTSSSSNSLLSSETSSVSSYNKLNGDYSESVSYDVNTNLIGFQRYGMKNDKTYGLIDDLIISHNGNKCISVTDNEDESLDYNGAFDFVDSSKTEDEYSYNRNGALKVDANKGISWISYDWFCHPTYITMSDNRYIDYIYAPAGRRLQEYYHQNKKVGRRYVTIDRGIKQYIDNLILVDSIPAMYLFDGGYFSFDSNGKLNGCHLYVQDYQGNNRMVVNASNDSIEQITHYYPFGGVIGDLSTNQDLQKYKYGGKELDRTYGLDLYDFHARQYDATVPAFSSIDPMAEKYYGISPYAYCAGDPVNCIDPTGCDAKIVVDGNNITVVANIVLTGKDATQELADIYKNSISEQWEKINTFVAEDGSEYSVSWDVNVTVDTSIDLDAGDTPERDGQTNYMQVMTKPRNDKNGKESHSGLSRNGYTGHIRAFGNSIGSFSETNPLPHEFGHMMGLKDRYYTKSEAANGIGKYGECYPGWEGSMMAMPAGLGKADSKQLAGPLNHAIAIKSMCGWVKQSPVVYNYKINLNSIRVGSGTYHE